MRSQIDYIDAEIEEYFDNRIRIEEIEFTLQTLSSFFQLRRQFYLMGVVDYESVFKVVFNHVRIFGDSPIQTLYVVDFGTVRGVTLI